MGLKAFTKLYEEEACILVIRKEAPPPPKTKTRLCLRSKVGSSESGITAAYLRWRIVGPTVLFTSSRKACRPQPPPPSQNEQLRFELRT